MFIFATGVCIAGCPGHPFLFQVGEQRFFGKFCIRKFRLGSCSYMYLARGACMHGDLIWDNPTFADIHLFFTCLVKHIDMYTYIQLRSQTYNFAYSYVCTCRYNFTVVHAVLHL